MGEFFPLQFFSFVLIRVDCWQLPPPDGGLPENIHYEYIAAARRYVPSATLARGQGSLWSLPATGMQGVTSFAGCERCDDAQIREVQEDFGDGR